MPDNDSVMFPELPKFPSPYTEEDAILLEDLKKQKQEFQKIYQGITPQAWEERPLWKKVLGNIAEETLTKGIFDPVISQFPNWEGSWTPELGQQRKEELDLQIFELERKQRVTNRIPVIQAELTYYALTGEAVQDPALLQRIFSDLGKDFTEEERNWVTAFAARLAISTPEEILSGVALTGKEITGDDIASWIKDTSLSIDPRFILSTVAFSKNQTQIGNALQQAYPPNVEGVDDTELVNKRIEELEEGFRAWAIEQGFALEETKSSQWKGVPYKHDVGELKNLKVNPIVQINELVSKNEGFRQPYKDPATGDIYEIELMSNGDVYTDNKIGKELVGTYNPETMEFFPLSDEEQVFNLDQIPFTVMTEEGEEFNLTFKVSDNTVWSGEEEIGSLDEGGNFVPKEPGFWGKTGEIAFTGLDIAFAPAKIVGMGIYSTMFAPTKTEQEAIAAEWYDEELKQLQIDIFGEEFGAIHFTNKDDVRMKGYLRGVQILMDASRAMGGQYFEDQFAYERRMTEQYEAQPWWTQLLWELPFWVALGAAGVSATAGRAALAPAAAGGGFSGASAQAARIALAPMAGYEWAVGKTMHYVLGVPAKKVLETASNKYFQTLWSKSFPSMIFPKGSPEATDMFKIWKLFHTKPPAGQPSNFYENAATQAFNQNINSSLKFREGISSWMKDIAAKSGTPEEDAVNLFLLSRTASPMAEASSETADVISNILKGLVDTKTPISGVTTSTIAKLVTGGIILDKPESLVSYLMESGYPKSVITGMSPEEAWAILISGKMPPEIVFPGEEPTVSPADALLAAKKAAIDSELAVFESSLNNLEIKIAKMKEAKALPYEVASLEETALGLTERINILTKAKSKLADSRVVLEPTTGAIWDSFPPDTKSSWLVSAEMDKALSGRNWADLTTGEQTKLIDARALLPTDAVRVPPEVIPEVVSLPPHVPPKVKASLEPKPARFPKTSEGLAKIPSMEEELQIIKDIIASNPVLSSSKATVAVRVSPVKSQSMGKAKDSWATLDKNYQEALTKVKDARTALQKAPIDDKPNKIILLEEAKESLLLARNAKAQLARDAGLKQPLKDKVKKSWDELSEWNRETLAIHSIPEGSLKPSSHWFVPQEAVRLFDARYEFMFYDEAFGGLIPFYREYQRISLKAKGVIEHKLRELESRIGADPNLFGVRNNEGALVQVEQAINSENVALNIQRPTGLTDEQELLIQILTDGFKKAEPMARVAKFEKFYNSDMDKMLKFYPDVKDAGLESELQQAIELYQRYQLSLKTFFDTSLENRPLVTTIKEDSWDKFVSFMSERDWGLVKNGYTPWITSNPGLLKEAPSVPLWAARGAGRFMKRGFHFPSGMTNILRRYYAYHRQLYSYWYLREEWESLAHLVEKASPKLDNPDLLSKIMTGYRDVVEGYPGEDSLIVKMMARVRRSAATAIFNTYPWLPYRNIHQGAAFSYDRSYYMRAQLGEKLPKDMMLMYDTFYDYMVSQMRGIRYDWLWGGEKQLWEIGAKSLPEGTPKVVKGLVAAYDIATYPLSAAARIADNFSLYPHSDDIIRKTSGLGYALKIHHATEKYLKDGDLAKWIKDSGIMHLTRTEQDYAKVLLHAPTWDFGIPGMRDIPGHQAIVFWGAGELDNSTHFVYSRSERGELEWGTAGRILFELATFQRQYVQRHYLQLEKLLNTNKDTPWAERKDAVRNTMFMLIYGSLLSSWIGWSSGRNYRAPYDPFDILNWEVGGFGIGVTQEITQAVRQLMIAMHPDSSQLEKDRAITNVVTKGTALADTLLPYYKVIMDSAGAILDLEPGVRIDREFLKDIRAVLDENYTKEELEKAEMSMAERLKKALFGGVPVEGTVYQQTLKTLQDKEAKLGGIDDGFKFYTLKDFGNLIQASQKEIPLDMFTEQHLFSPLVLEYVEYAQVFNELERTSSRGDARDTFRRNQGVDFEAWLLFWGKRTNTAFNRREDREERQQIRAILLKLFELYEIDSQEHSHFDEWNTLTKEEWNEVVQKGF